MGKDELIKQLEKWIICRFVECPQGVSVKEEDASNQIKEILNLHFSISDGERQEAARWLNDEPIGDKTQTRVYKTILRALGEKVG